MGDTRPPEGWLELNGQLFNPSGNPVLTSLYPTGQVPDFGDIPEAGIMVQELIQMSGLC
ncbi:phage tail protein [Pectobacterium odoriferum]|uniref:phage tail protein n=1 Tax=Pectobacterium odoriferum TaxID=78398 RepID=UPI001FCC3E85|nr:phage tail protein [Pectobacterium odoriferum]